MIRGLAWTLALALLPGLARAATWEIAPGGSDSTGTGSLAAPFASCTKAQAAASAGDIIEWQPGTYSIGCTITLAGASHAAPTVFRCAVDSLAGIGSAATSCIVRATAYQAFQVNAKHTLLGGAGHGFDIASTGATNPASNLPSPAVQNLLRPAIDSVVQANYVHDSPGGCIVFTQSDWSFVLNNVTARCAAGSPNQTSGISVGFGTQSPYDNAADLPNLPYHGQYETLVAGNLSYGNFGCAQALTYSSSSTYVTGQTVYWLDTNGSNYVWTAAQAIVANQPPSSANSTWWTRGLQVCPPVKTDANGIIVDTNNQSGYTSGPSLVENNIVWGNGGRGVHCYLSTGATLRHNTAYGDVQDTLLGSYGNEVNAQSCPAAQVYNNAAIATQTAAIGGVSPAAFALEANIASQADWDVGKAASGQHSYVTGGNGGGFGSHVQFGMDPLFAGSPPPVTGYVSLAQAAAAFAPAATSPLRGAAWPIFAPARDIVGTARPMRWGNAIGVSRVDIGAVQVTP